MSFEENTADFIPAPTEEEVDSAVTKSIHNVMAVVSATLHPETYATSRSAWILKRFGRYVNLNS